MVAVFAQGPIGLCATAGAKLLGASTIIAVDRLPERLDMARRHGADYVVDFSKVDPVAEILRITDGRGVDVAIELLGTQSTFELCLRVLRPGGTLSSLWRLFVRSEDTGRRLRDGTRRPYDRDNALPRREGAHATIDGGDRIQECVDLSAMATHRFKLDEIEAAYDFFANQRDGVFKVRRDCAATGTAAFPAVEVELTRG